MSGIEEFKEEDNNLNIKSEKTPNQVIDTLADGTEILRDEVEEKEEITDKDLRNLVLYATGEKNLTDEDLEKLRNDDVELERLTKIFFIKRNHLTYAPKKNFGSSYKQNRQRKNRATNKTRAINR